MPFHLEYLLGDRQLILVCFLNVLINMLMLTTNAARVAGAETRRVATALSLFNLFATTFRLLNLFYAPLLANIADKLSKEGNVEILMIKFQYVIFSAAVGSFLGFIFLPTFIEIYKLGINAMQNHGSIPQIAIAFVKRPTNFLKLVKCLRKPSFLGVDFRRVGEIPRSFLFFNLLGTSMWTIGVISSTFASVLNQDLVRTSIHLSGIVNGIGTIMLFVLVEPVSALVVDRVVTKDRPLDHAKIMVIWLSFTAILGNLLGIILMSPAANYILLISKLIGGK